MKAIQRRLLAGAVTVIVGMLLWLLFTLAALTVIGVSFVGYLAISAILGGEIIVGAGMLGALGAVAVVVLLAVEFGKEL